MSAQSALAWVQNGVVHSVQPNTASLQTRATFVASSVLQWPLLPACAAALPFVACCLLGLETSIGSNVVLWSQTLLLVVAVVFDGALLLPLLTTAVALLGFGVTAERADHMCFFFACICHLLFALLGAVAWTQVPSVHKSLALARVDVLSACFCAVLCAEARIRAATSAMPTRQRVLWACRAAAVGCVPSLVFRGLAEKSTSTSHIATAALACVALCSPWFWNTHRVWRAQRVSPPVAVAGDALMLGVVFVCLLLIAFALPSAGWIEK